MDFYLLIIHTIYWNVIVTVNQDSRLFLRVAGANHFLETHQKIVLLREPRRHTGKMGRISLLHIEFHLNCQENQSNIRRSKTLVFCFLFTKIFFQYISYILQSSNREQHICFFFVVLCAIERNEDISNVVIPIILSKKKGWPASDFATSIRTVYVIFNSTHICGVGLW